MVHERSRPSVGRAPRFRAERERLRLLGERYQARMTSNWHSGRIARGTAGSRRRTAERKPRSADDGLQDARDGASGTSMKRPTCARRMERRTLAYPPARRRPHPIAEGGHRFGDS
jgi:hypothetical protein